MRCNENLIAFVRVHWRSWRWTRTVQILQMARNREKNLLVRDAVMLYVDNLRLSDIYRDMCMCTVRYLYMANYN